MTDLISSLDETLTILRAADEARRFEGTEVEEAMLRHAAEIPSWEIAKCWRYEDWPEGSDSTHALMTSSSPESNDRRRSPSKGPRRPETVDGPARDRTARGKTSLCE